MTHYHTWDLEEDTVCSRCRAIHPFRLRLDQTRYENEELYQKIRKMEAYILELEYGYKPQLHKY